MLATTTTRQEKQLLFLGSQDKSIKFYYTTTNSTKVTDAIEGSICDAVNGVSVNEFPDGSIMVEVSVGTRRFATEAEDAYYRVL